VRDGQRVRNSSGRDVFLPLWATPKSEDFHVGRGRHFRRAAQGQNHGLALRRMARSSIKPRRFAGIVSGFYATNRR